MDECIKPLVAGAREEERAVGRARCRGEGGGGLGRGVTAFVPVPFPAPFFAPSAAFFPAFLLASFPAPISPASPSLPASAARCLLSFNVVMTPVFLCGVIVSVVDAIGKQRLDRTTEHDSPIGWMHMQTYVTRFVVYTRPS